MTTYSKKYFNTATQKWEPLLATEARSAYEIAVENGYEGTEEEFNKALGTVGSVDLAIDSVPTADSKNLVYSGGVKSALNELETKIDNLEIPTVDLTDYYTKQEIEDKNYATETELNDKFNSIVIPETDLSNYYTKQEVEDKNYLTEVPSEYLTKTEAQQSYQKILSTTDPLFKLNGNQVLYGSDIVIDTNGDVTVETAETLTLFAYTSNEGEPISRPTGGSVIKNESGYVITYPDGWHDSEWAQTELTTYPEKTIWYSYATFIVDNTAPIIDWAYPMYYAKDGKPGEDGENGKDGASIEYVYYLQAGANKAWNGNVEAPSNDWKYDAPVDPWKDSPVGVDVNNQTEWVYVRTKAPGAESWNAWQGPALWSVFGEEGKDGAGLEYIFKLTEGYVAPIEVAELDAVQEDDYVPTDWSDNILEVDETNNFLWCSIRRKKDGVWSKFETPKCWGKYVKDGEPGTDGLTGLIAYPAGVYDPSTVYTSDSKKTPYVYDSTYESYYVINTANTTWEANAGSPGTDTQELVWTKFEMFDAIYTKVGIVANGLIGSAVFNGDYMFSQQGVLYTDGVGTASENYELFDPSVVEDVFNGTEITSGFVPNILFDLNTGRGWFGAGETLIYEDGSIVTRHIATVYEHIDVVETPTYVNSLLTTASWFYCGGSITEETPAHMELRLTDTAINKPGVWYEGEIIPKACDTATLLVGIDSTYYFVAANNRAPGNRYAMDKNHTFRFLFNWDGNVVDGIKTGEIIVVEPYYIDEIADTLVYDADTEITDVIVNQYNSDKVLVCPANYSITFNNTVYKLEGNVSVVQGTKAQYKAYALHYVSDNIILVNCSLYG